MNVSERDWSGWLWVGGLTLLIGVPLLFVLFGRWGAAVLIGVVGVSAACAAPRIVSGALARRRAPWRPAGARVRLFGRRAVLRRLARRLPELQRARSYAIEHMIHGMRNGCRYWACDLRRWHAEHGEYAMVFVAARIGVDLGRIQIRPERPEHDVAAAFGYDDLDFESAEFSRRFHVQAEDRKKAYALLHPQMLELLMAHRSLQLAVTSRWVLMEDAGGDFQRLLPVALEFLDLIPRHLQ